MAQHSVSQPVGHSAVFEWVTELIISKSNHYSVVKHWLCSEATFSLNCTQE